MEYSEMTDLTGLLKDGDDGGEPTSPHNLKFHNPKIFLCGDTTLGRRYTAIETFNSFVSLREQE